MRSCSISYFAINSWAFNIAAFASFSLSEPDKAISFRFFNDFCFSSSFIVCRFPGTLPSTPCRQYAKIADIFRLLLPYNCLILQVIVHGVEFQSVNRTTQPPFEALRPRGRPQKITLSPRFSKAYQPVYKRFVRFSDFRPRSGGSKRHPSKIYCDNHLYT